MARIGQGEPILKGLDAIRESLATAIQIEQKGKQLALQEQAMTIQADQGQQRIDFQNKQQKIEVFRALLSSGALDKASTKTIGKELQTEMLGDIDRTISLKPPQQQTLSLQDRIALIGAKTAAEKEVITAQQKKDIAVLEKTEEGRQFRQTRKLTQQEKGRVSAAAIKLLQEGATLEQVLTAKQQGTLLGVGEVPSKTPQQVVGKGEEKGLIFTQEDPITFVEVAEAFGVNQEGNIVADQPIKAFGDRTITQAISQYSDFVNRTPRPDIEVLQKARDTLLEVDPRIEPFLDRIEGKK